MSDYFAKLCSVILEIKLPAIEAELSQADVIEMTRNSLVVLQ